MSVATLVYIIVVVALGVFNRFLYEAVASDAVTTRSPDQIDDFAARFASYITSAGGVVTVLGWIVITVVLTVMQSAYFAGMLDVANGHQVKMGSFFKPRSVGNVIVAGLIVEVVTWIGFGVCVIGGIIARTALIVHDRRSARPPPPGARGGRRQLHDRKSELLEVAARAVGRVRHPVPSASWRVASGSSSPSR